MRTLQAFVSCVAHTLTLGFITSDTVFAQTGAESVIGIITDQSGATVPGATPQTETATVGGEVINS